MSFLNNLASSLSRLLSVELTIDDYQVFLEKVHAFQSSNDTYINIARLNRSSFFVLHHDVHRDMEKMMGVAELEYSLGWKANYFLRDDTALMDLNYVRSMLNMHHDVGYLYDHLQKAIMMYPKLSYREQCDKAWLIYQNVLRHNVLLNMTATACYNEKRGVDNKAMWKEYRYKTAGVRCDADMDFQAEEVVCFTIEGKKISYQMRGRDGEYRALDPGKRIKGVGDLGERLKKGNRVDRMVLRFVWR